MGPNGASVKPGLILCGRALLLVALSGGGSGWAAEGEATNLGAALTRGSVKAALRYRFEGVDDEGFDLAGDASTLRLALGYETKTWRGFAAFVEFESVTDLGLADRHANGAPGRLDNGVHGRPVIADPELTQVNQVLLRFKRARTTLEAGRFELALGNERFVGPVGWRQNHQSFDGARIEQRLGSRARVGYSWFGAVNRITGDRKPMSSHLGYGSFDVSPKVRLHAMVLALGYDRTEDARLSSLTTWAGVATTVPSGRWTWQLDAELGWQRDAGGNPARVDEPYLRAALGARRAGLSARAGLEVLGGSLEPGHGSLQTPLATLHAWNGWADRFLATPPAGLRDAWLSLGLDAGKVKVLGVWHDLRADAGDARYGSEWDLLATWDLAWKQQLAAKVALYDADALGSDTAKVWLYTTWGF